MKKSAKSEEQILLDRLHRIRYYTFCDPGCWGRCLECPSDVINDVVRYLERKSVVVED